MIAAHPDDENTALLAYLARGAKLRTGYLSLTRGEGGQNLIGPEQGDELGILGALRFTGTKRNGHGQHQASAILGKEAFSAADPARFTEQLQWVQPRQAKRVIWNAFAFFKEQEEEFAKIADKIVVDPGEYDSVLGHSYAEIAGMSRSMHRSQGMGAPERPGSARNYLVIVGGAAAVGKLLAELHQPVVDRKRRELDETIALCSGLWLDATADRYGVVPGGELKFRVTAISRERIANQVESVNVDGIATATAKDRDSSALPFNEPKTFSLDVTIPGAYVFTAFSWFRELPAGVPGAFRIFANLLNAGKTL